MRNDGSSNILAELKLDSSSGEQLHIQLQRQIRDRIQANQLRPGEKLPTNFAISDHLHVSYETVQRAMRTLADHGLVVRRKSKGTFVREAAIPQLVGIFCTETVFDPRESAFTSLLAHHLSHSLHAEKRDLRLYYAPEPQWGKVKAYHDLVHDITDRRLAGVIAINRMSEQLTELAMQKSFPMVGVVVDERMAHTVWIDHLDFCRRALSGMTKKGCRRIALLGFSTGIERTSIPNLIKVATEAGLEFTADDVKGTDRTYRGDWRDLGAELARNSNISAYDGVVIADDIITIGFTQELARMGVRVPDDLKLATLWNRGSPYSPPAGATLFEVNVKQLAMRSVQMLDEVIDGQIRGRSHAYVKLEEQAKPREPRREAVLS